MIKMICDLKNRLIKSKECTKELACTVQCGMERYIRESQHLRSFFFFLQISVGEPYSRYKLSTSIT